MECIGAEAAIIFRGEYDGLDRVSIVRVVASGEKVRVMRWRPVALQRISFWHGRVLKGATTDVFDVVLS